uniref:Peptidase S1 domain-containing protein n=1 Tax=Anopheles dirus TaxID=7168 RepID=A0A182N384_9DIPT
MKNVAIFSAAHCLYKDQATIASHLVLVHVGKTHRFNSYGNSRTHEPDRFIIHPEFQAATLRHDIALIKLKTEIEMSYYIQPVCLWPTGSEHENVVNRNGSVVGFGFYKDSDPSDHLLEAEVPVVNPLNCLDNERDTLGHLLTSTMLCAGARNGTGPCNGDSGGGLFLEIDNVWYIRGLVSFARNIINSKRCHPNGYVIYTDVSKYIEWINEPHDNEDDSEPYDCGLPFQHNFHRSTLTGVIYPWVAIIEHIDSVRPTNRACHAFIITKLHLLTTASCVEDEHNNYQELKVRFHRILHHVSPEYKEKLKPSSLVVKDIILHDRYDQPKYANDIAILKLHREINFINYIKPVCVPSEDRKNVNIMKMRQFVGNSSKFFMLDDEEFQTCIEAHSKSGITLPTDGQYFCVKVDNAWYDEDMNRPAEVLRYEGSTADNGPAYLYGLQSGRFPVTENPHYEAVLNVSSQRCGMRKVHHTNLILNGKQVPAGKWPWHAAIAHRSMVVCGGSIIDKLTILTAAHCLYTQGPSKSVIAPYIVFVHVGKTQEFASDAHTRTYDPEYFVIHPNYQPDEVHDDIALIKLKSMIEMGNFVQPVCLWPTKPTLQNVDGKIGSVVGFGLRNDNELSKYLLEADVPVVDLVMCLESNRGTFGQTLSTKVLCAGARNGTGPCNGDSGGGLFLEMDNVWYIRGIVSFTPTLLNNNHCDPNEYIIYTDVSKYIEWINEPHDKEDDSTQLMSVEPVTLEPYDCGLPFQHNFHRSTLTGVIYPWVATIANVDNLPSTKRACHAFIITKLHLLTTASCVEDEHNNYQDLVVEEIILHERYDQPKYANDIALLKLRREINFDNYITPTRATAGLGIIVVCVILIELMSPLLVLTCGVRKVKINKLLFGGRQVQNGKWPWHASISHKREAFFELVCGGSIIDKRTVLTAAHCLFEDRALISPARVLVHVGRTHLHIVDSRSRSYIPDQLILHPGYRQDDVQDDIALVRLGTEIQMSEYIQPVCLWPIGFDHEHVTRKLGSVLGFGLYNESRMSDSLLEAQVPVVDLVECLESNRPSFGPSISSRMLCAGARNRVGPCNGDSGGGLFFQLNSVWHIRGIVSFAPSLNGEAICDPTQYTVYMDVSKYIGWIWGTYNENIQAAKERMARLESKQKASLETINCGTPYRRKLSGGRGEGHAFPSTALIEYIGKLHPYAETSCHALIISNWHLLTTASCVVDARDNDLEISVKFLRNFHNMSKEIHDEHEPYRKFVSRIIIHDQYDTFGYGDIALLKLHKQIKFGTYVAPICLPSAADTVTNLRKMRIFDEGNSVFASVEEDL